jgi:predicted RecA/RadA family phage recombinase
MALANSKIVLSGDSVPITNGATAVDQFEIVKIGTDLRGFATSDFAASGPGDVGLEGILDLPSATSLTCAPGQVAYWDATKKEISQVVTALPIGWITTTSTNATTQRVLLDPALKQCVEITVASGATTGTATITGLRAGEHLAYGVMAQGANVRTVNSVVATANTATVTVSGDPGSGGCKVWVRRAV